MKFKLNGTKQMRARLQQIAKQFPTKVMGALYVEANIILTESKRRCPVAPDGGILRSSGVVHKPVRKGSGFSITLSYGGAAQAYALAVHEHLSEHSPPSWIVAELSGKGINWSVDGTGPKFLEEPINEALPTIADNIGHRIKF